MRLFWKRANAERLNKKWREYYRKRKLENPNWLHETYENRKLNEKDYFEKRKYYGRKSRTNIRNEVINHYGGKCECCGEILNEFLAIDHINGDGGKHRKKVGHIYSWLKRNSYPIGFRVLCHNCNCAKGFYGYCPHNNYE